MKTAERKIVRSLAMLAIGLMILSAVTARAANDYGDVFHYWLAWTCALSLIGAIVCCAASVIGYAAYNEEEK
jgi:hypothetical protein